MDFKDWTVNGKERFTTPGIPPAPAEKSGKTFSFTRTPRQPAEDAPKPEPQLAPEPRIEPEPLSAPEPQITPEPCTEPEPQITLEPTSKKTFSLPRTFRQRTESAPKPEPQLAPEPLIAPEPPIAPEPRMEPEEFRSTLPRFVPEPKRRNLFPFSRKARQSREDAPTLDPLSTSLPYAEPEPQLAPEPQIVSEPRTAPEEFAMPEPRTLPEEPSMPEPRMEPEEFRSTLPRFVPEPKRRKIFPFSRKSRQGSEEAPTLDPLHASLPYSEPEPQTAYDPQAAQELKIAPEAQAAALGIIGGADGPTAIYLSAKHAPDPPAAPEPQITPEPQTGPEPFRASVQHLDPFSSIVPNEVSNPWYANIQDATLRNPGAVVQSHDREAASYSAAPQGIQAPVGYTVTTGAQGGYVLTPQNVRGPQVITIQIPPPAPRKAPAKKPNLWWIPVTLVLTLLIGLLGGFVVSSLLSGRGTPPTNAVTEPIGTQPAGSQPAASQPAGTQPADSSAGRIYQENVEAVVGILALPPKGAGGTEYVSASAGTGFLISEDGYLLTNAHVVEGAAKITVTRSNGQTFEARLVAQETAASDLALLKIDASGLPAVRIGNSDRVQVGDAVFTIGNPLGELSFSLTTGYVSAGLRQVNTGTATLTMLQTNAAINKGNSGGPLFDAAGQVIGVVTAKLSASESDAVPLEGLGFALPINAVMELAEGWMANDRR